jgi:putative membrane protein
MRLMIILPVAASILLVQPAAAQFGNPAGVAPGTKHEAPGAPSPHETNNQDRLFARLATTGGRSEVELGRLAQEKGTNQAVKDFARMMVADHSQANEKLVGLAKEAEILLPAELTPEQRALRAKLEQVSGDNFDVAYMLTQIEDHQKTVQLLQWEIGSGQDAPMQKFAAETLPIVLEHLRRAHVIAAELTGQTPLEMTSRPMERR